MRILIAIGCNRYDHQDDLDGAERDAQQIFNVLIRPDRGEYDAERSRLLLSPTSVEVREALRQVLFPGEPIDTFTFFFAGHGGVRSGSFYMLVQDSSSEALSFSAVSLSDLFLAISEAVPAQSNIVIDACESGGLISDLGVLLKSELLGDAETPGITLVATSAQDQPSGETPAGGLGTNAILDCIEGRDFVQDTASALDLVEIGRRVSSRLRETSDQSPVVWGLNLYGPPRFCRNPRFGSDPGKPLRDVVQAWPVAGDTSIRAHYDALWRAYASVSGDWNPRAFSKVIDTVVAPIASEPDVLAAFFERWGATVLERAQFADDAFRPAQVAAALAVSLLPYVEFDAVASQARRFLETAGEPLIAAGQEVCDELDRERFTLLAPRGGGLSELFYLPLRVANLLGWTAAAPLLFAPDDPRGAAAAEIFGRILRQVLQHYSGSVTAMSDAQAPCWSVALAMAIRLGFTDQAEQLLGLVYASLIDCKGEVAREDIPADKVLAYLLARQGRDFGSVLDLVARPEETMSVVLKAAHLLGLDDVIDADLWELDGHAFLAYLPHEFAQFGADTMRGGENLVWTVGHHIFRVSDVVASWPAKTPNPTNDLVAASAVVAALLYPDRIPWFLLEPDDDAAAGVDG